MIKGKVFPFKLAYEQYHWLREAAHNKHISMGELLRNLLDTARDVESKRD